MTVLTAADYADTGQWRLLVDISTTGISAFLENTLHEDVELQPLFSSSWDENPDSLLENIENAVYDHPRVLDDFATRINVHDPRAIMVPEGFETEDEGTEESVYAELFDAKESDVFIDRHDGVCAVYSLCPGLKGFLSRTFPGSRIECNLMHSLKKTPTPESGYNLHIANSNGETVFILLGIDGLLSASSHVCRDGADIAYHAFNILDVYGVNPKDTMVMANKGTLPDETAEAFLKFTKGMNRIEK